MLLNYSSISLLNLINNHYQLIRLLIKVQTIRQFVLFDHHFTLLNPFVPTVPTFAVRETASLGIMGEPRQCSQSTIVSEGFKGGTRGAPIMPRDAVSRTANVGTVGNLNMIYRRQRSGILFRQTKFLTFFNLLIFVHRISEKVIK